MSQFAEYHAELRAVARGVLAPASPLSSGGREPTPVDWNVLARSGWLALEVPESLEGAAATFSEVAIVVQEMGAAATRSPYLGSVVLGIGALNMLGATDARDDLLLKAGTGEARLAVALAADEDAGPSPVAFTLRRTRSGIRLHGEARFVPDAAQAGHLLLLADDGGEPVIVVMDGRAAGLSQEVEVTDPTRDVARVSADGTPVGDTDVWRFVGDAGSAVSRLYDRAALALACDSLGGAEAMLTATVDYARVREQFGRPIGSFQAVQHACADMLVQVSVGRELVTAALTAVSAGERDSWVAVAQAKSYLCQAAVEIAGKAMQLHGGIGYTWESGIHFYLRRALFNRSWFGSPGWHRRRLGARFA